MSTVNVDIESLIDRHREEVEAEIEKLRPAHEEYERLMAYREGMGKPPSARRTTRTRRSGGGGGGGGNADRPQQFLDAVKANPGASIPQIAEAIGDVSANYLYRVRDALVDEGKIRKEGQQHFVVEQQTGSGRSRAKAGATS